MWLTLLPQVFGCGVVPNHQLGTASSENDAPLDNCDQFLCQQLPCVHLQLIALTRLVHHCCPAAAAGIDDPYEEPEAAELVLEAVDKAGQMVAPQVSAAKILEYLHAKRII
jgi:hypothetical protein